METQWSRYEERIRVVSRPLWRNTRDSPRLAWIDVAFSQFLYTCTVHYYLRSQKFDFLSPALLGLPPAVMDNTRSPAFPVAHGVNSNFDNLVSQGKALVAIDILCITLMLVFVGMRLYAKHCIVHPLGWGEWESRLLCQPPN